MDTNEWMTRAEAAAYLGVTTATVDRWARRGILRRYRLHRGVQRVRLDRAEVETLLRPVEDPGPHSPAGIG